MPDLHAVEGPQLTFDVWEGDAPPDPPAVATIQVSGALEELERELNQDEMVVITIADQHGTVVASGHGNIDVGFKRKTTTDISYVVRKHTVVL